MVNFISYSADSVTDALDTIVGLYWVFTAGVYVGWWY